MPKIVETSDVGIVNARPFNPAALVTIIRDRIGKVLQKTPDTM
jgi:hypothetical protein